MHGCSHGALAAAGRYGRFGYRDDGTVLGTGALNELDFAHGELTSTHAPAGASGRGVGRVTAATR